MLFMGAFYSKGGPLPLGGVLDPDRVGVGKKYHKATLCNLALCGGNKNNKPAGTDGYETHTNAAMTKE